MASGISATSQSLKSLLSLPESYNSTQVPQTGGLINNRNLFFTVLEAGSVRSGCPQDQGRAVFQEADWGLLIVSSQGRRMAREPCEVAVIRALSPSMRAPPS